MNTWTCKRLLSGLAGLSLLALAACTEADLASLTAAPGPARTTAGTAEEIDAGILLGDGRVALMPPAGFCIDPDSVTSSGREGFAMLARCHNLSPQTALTHLAGQAPAVMTVITKPWTEGDTPITATTIAAAYPAGAVIETRNGPAIPMVKARGEAALSGLDETHWRGAFVINDQLVVLGLFAPEDSRALGSAGARLLGQLASRTQSASRSIAAPLAASARD